MKTLILLSILFVTACGGKSVVEVEPAHEGGTGDIQSDGRPPDDAAAETRSDCAFVVGRVACDTRAHAYCNAFVPCLLASGKAAANNGEHYDTIEQCLQVIAQFCEGTDWHTAVCRSNLSVCVDDLQHTECEIFMQEDLTLPASCEIYVGLTGGLGGEPAPASHH